MKKFGLLKIAGLGLLTILGGCSVAGGTAGTTYDGVWSGLITLNLGDKSCMRRENFIVTIEDGYFTGKTRTIKYKTKISGNIDEVGEIYAGKFRLGTVTRDAEMTGVFTEKTAEGEWQSKRCKGKWTLRRIR